MPTPSDLALVDMKVLVESLFKGSLHHGATVALLERAQAGEVAFCVLQQLRAESLSPS